jgi:hypothetical protein
VGVSYRLTPETGERLLAEFAEAADDLHRRGVRFAFGGTPPGAERAACIGFFERVFDGSQPPEEVAAYLRGATLSVSEPAYPQSTVERIAWKAPYPLLRHHFGLPTMEATLAGIEQIAEANALDGISLGIDQDAQENFFHPERQDPCRTGAGGVAVRSADDYRALYAASRRGNYPLMRTYSGTDDFIQLAMVYVDTISIAWAAVPLFWFNAMDGRGPHDLETSIRLHQELMAWYGQQGIPVELNEPHHWGMRDAPDIVFVVAAYLSAYNARAFGVRQYIARFMFNSPPGLSDAMDLAAVTSEDVIAARKVARRAIENALGGAPDMLESRAIQERVAELVAEARLTLDAIRSLAGRNVADPLIDPDTLCAAVTHGILDASHLRNNRFGRGAVRTGVDRRGACVALAPDGSRSLSEAERLAGLRSGL